MRRIPLYALLVGLFSVCPAITGEKADDSFFLKDGMTWVLLGDSITEQHLHADYIEAYCHLRFPKWKLHIRGAGRGGSQIPESLERFESDVAIWSPTAVSVELGINGGDAIDKFKADLDTLCKAIQDIGAQPVLLSFHPAYREDAGTHPKRLRAQAHIDHARAKGFACVDQYGLLWPTWERNLGSAKPVDFQYPMRDGKPDNIHPGPPAHLIKTYVILKGLGAPGAVSSAEIDARRGELLKAEGCEVTEVQKQASGVAFTRLDSRLPLVFDEKARDALTLVPDILEMSRYMLTVGGLAAGQYELLVDGKPAARVDAGDLARGWNLTQMTGGPIYDQCQEVLRLVRVKEGVSGEKPSVGSIRFAARMDLQRSGVKGQALKDKVKANVQKMLDRDEAIRQAAQPKARRFELRKPRTP